MSPRPVRSTRRSAAGKARRRAIQRAHQRDKWAHQANVLSSLSEDLKGVEDSGRRQHDEWLSNYLLSISDGTSDPTFAMWTPTLGPLTQTQTRIISSLQETSATLHASPVGAQITAWLNSDTAQQNDSSSFWATIEPFLTEAAELLRKTWSTLLDIQDRPALIGGTLRPPLMKAVVETMHLSSIEDLDILSEIDVGTNIGVCHDIPPSGLWPSFSPHLDKVFDTTMFGLEAFRNYSSAEDNPQQVNQILEAEVSLGRMRRVLPKDIEPNAIISRIAAIEKPRISLDAPQRWRLIDDMRRSNLNNLIRPHLVETVSLPRLESLALLMKKAISRSSSSDARFLVLDVKGAYRHVRVAASDECYLYNKCPLTGHYYRHRALPFGMASSPLLWVRCYATVIRCIRRLSQQDAILYIDDSPWTTSVPHLLSDFLHIVLPALAFGIHLELSKVRCSSRPKVLGLVCSLPDETISLAPSKQQQTLTLAEQTLWSFSHSKPILVREVEVLLGRLSWISQLIPHYRCRLSPIFAWVAALKKKGIRAAQLSTHVSTSITAFTRLLRRGSEVNRTLSSILCDTDGRIVVTSDASLLGLGGTCSVFRNGTIAHRYWYACRFDALDEPHQRLLHSLAPTTDGPNYLSSDISVLELLAASLGYLLLPDNGEMYTMLSDNTPTVGVFNKASSPSPRLSNLFLKVVSLKPLENRCRAFHIKGVHNTTSDTLSRSSSLQSLRGIGTRISVEPLLSRLASTSL